MIHESGKSPVLWSGEGYIKSRHPNFGFIRSDSGIDLFFLPTGVDASVCPFKRLIEGARCQFDVYHHARGLRATHIVQLNGTESDRA